MVISTPISYILRQERNGIQLPMLSVHVLSRASGANMQGSYTDLGVTSVFSRMIVLHQIISLRELFISVAADEERFAQ